MLVDSFVKGAESAGHTCEVVDVCHANIHPCIGCVRCGYEGSCVQKDDVKTIRGKRLSSEMVVFATPLYYYGMTAQLKTVIAHYKTLVRYINFEDQGMILGYGCGTPTMTKRSRYPNQAYALGKNL